MKTCILALQLERVLLFKGSDLSEATAEGEDKEERKGGTEMFLVPLIECIELLPVLSTKSSKLYINFFIPLIY